MRLRKLLRECREVTVVRPGDALVFRVGNITAEHADNLIRLLRERLAYLNVEILIASGVESIEVLRKVGTP